MVYTKKFLISELQRFVKENGRNPKVKDFIKNKEYPGFYSYIKYFGSWNNALIEAGLEANQYSLNGEETCNKCGKNKPKNQGWCYRNKQRLCQSCHQKMSTDYMNGNLEPSSSTGFGFIGQRVVAKTLDLDLKYDCNCSQGFESEYDLYDKEKFGYINVKIATLNKDNAWQFLLINKRKPDTYIMLGLSIDKSNISHVWITEPEDDLTFDDKKFQFKQKISITNSERGLRRAKSWEVNAEPYNDAYHNMSLENCSVLKSD